MYPREVFRSNFIHNRLTNYDHWIHYMSTVEGTWTIFKITNKESILLLFYVPYYYWTLYLTTYHYFGRTGTTYYFILLCSLLLVLSFIWTYILNFQTNLNKYIKYINKGNYEDNNLSILYMYHTHIDIYSMVLTPPWSIDHYIM